MCPSSVVHSNVLEIWRSLQYFFINTLAQLSDHHAVFHMDCLCKWKISTWRMRLKSKRKKVISKRLLELLSLSQRESWYYFKCLKESESWKQYVCLFVMICLMFPDSWISWNREETQKGEICQLFSRWNPSFYLTLIFVNIQRLSLKWRPDVKLGNSFHSWESFNIQENDSTITRMWTKILCIIVSCHIWPQQLLFAFCPDLSKKSLSLDWSLFCGSLEPR